MGRKHLLKAMAPAILVDFGVTCAQASLQIYFRGRLSVPATNICRHCPVTSNTDLSQKAQRTPLSVSVLLLSFPSLQLKRKLL